MAPPEVIRAAYKALSQKYHPDKNPGDEKAARIMAILNSAYETLSDPQRRKEHDEWIAAEEWEIEWLESTKAEDEAKEVARHSGAKAGERTYSMVRDPKWWLTLLICLVLGWAVAVLMQIQFNFVQAVWPPTVSAPVPELKPPPKPTKLSEAKLALHTQVNLVGLDKPCELPARQDTAPNGENWPLKSGPIDGYKQGNLSITGDEMKLVLDNSGNASETMVTLFDQDKHLAVRYLLVRARDRLTLDNLQAGRYEVRQQVLGLHAAAKQACVAALDSGSTPDTVTPGPTAPPAPAGAATPQGGTPASS